MFKQLSNISENRSISILPDDIINLILDFIPKNIIAFTNKYYYNLYHYSIKRNIPLYESYVRHMISNNYFFIFETIMRENINNWIKNRNYRYKNMIFNNYIYFILYYCNEHNSFICREILIKEFQKRDLCRNLHKKNVIKYINGKFKYK